MDKLGFRLLVAAVGGCCTTAAATPMMAAWPYESIVRYDNDDELRVTCKKTLGGCHLHLTVGGKSFAYGAKDLDGLEPQPGEGVLYSGAGSGREEEFSFEVLVSCPTEATRPPYSTCFAHAVVDHGQLRDVKLIRRNIVDLPDSPE